MPETPLRGYITPGERDAVAHALIYAADARHEYATDATFKFQVDVLVGALPGMVRGLADQVGPRQVIQAQMTNLMERHPTLTADQARTMAERLRQDHVRCVPHGVVNCQRCADDF